MGFTVTETSFATTSYSFQFFSSGLWIIKIRSINYSLHFESVEIHKHCLYWKAFNTNIYKKIFSTFWCFFSYICWSVNCICWVSKFNNFFSDLHRNWGKIYIWGLWYCLLWKIHLQLTNILFAFFIWSVNCTGDFFSHFASQ